MEVTFLLFWLVVYLFACLSDRVLHFERGRGPPPPPSSLYPFPPTLTCLFTLEFQEPNAQSIYRLLFNVALAFYFWKYFLRNLLAYE